VSLSKGDIVLVPFPFTDLSQTKLRPAVVLWVDPQGQDITLCFVSSQNLDCISPSEFMLESSEPEFERTGLEVTSKVRVTKLVTIEQRLIQRRLGYLGAEQMRRLNQTLTQVFQLNE